LIAEAREWLADCGQGNGHQPSFLIRRPALIENKIKTLAVRGILETGDELHFTMNDVSGERKWNLRTLGQIAELQIDWTREMQAAQATGED
jgi:hypothetical protein